MSDEMAAIVTAAILSHNWEHDGEFLECHACEEVRIDIVECVRMELLIAALRREVAA